MAYVLPQVLVFQEFRIVPAAVQAPRQAHITGGHAQLFRYSESDEKDVIGVGAYDYTTETAYPWPERPAGAQVDFDYVKLFVDGALLPYHNDYVGSGGVIAPVTGFKNRVRSSVTSFKDNGTDYPKSASMKDRGAKVGDVAYVRGVGTDSNIYELWTKIRDFKGDVVAAVIEPSADADTNKAAQTLLVTIDDVGGKKNTITLTADASGFSGLEDGNIDETYTIEVKSSSVGGDLTTARLRVISASGTDNDSDVQPAGVGGFTAIGADGLLIEFDRNETTSASSAAVDDGIAPDDLVVGQKWKVRVQQAHTPATAASGGAYTGEKSTTYIVEVTKGGLWADEPEITVTTTTGVDKSGPTKVLAPSTDYPAGNYSLTIQFAGAGLCGGDKYYIEVAAEDEGALKTILLLDDLPEKIQTASDLDLRLFISRDVEITKNRTTEAPLTNFSTEDTQILVSAGITLFDAEWTDGGTPEALPLEGGDLFVQYRCWLVTYIGTVESAIDSGGLTQLLGQAHPDNPLFWGVYMALLNSGGQPVRFTAVADPIELNKWLDALEILIGRDDVYNLVPLTNWKSVQDAWKGHVVSQSSPEIGRWRAAAFGIAIDHISVLVSEANTTDGEVVLATLSDDPTATGTQYTRLSIPSGNAKFITNNVQPGDIVRYLYTTDGFGNDVWTEFEIDEVLSENTVRLSAGHTVAITVGQKAEVWRKLKNSGITQAVKEACGIWATRRVIAVANETVGNAGLTFPGYFAAAAIAGLRSGVNPHQGLTNVSLTGIDDVGTLVNGLNGSQLNEIAGAGGWIIFKTSDGHIINRHAVTTDNLDLNQREEMVRVNVDSISYTLLKVLEPYIGRSNVTPDTVSVIKGVIRDALLSMTTNIVPRIGAQLISFEIIDVRQHALLKDRIVAIINLVVPYPLNNIELRLVV